MNKLPTALGFFLGLTLSVHARPRITDTLTAPDGSKAALVRPAKHTGKPLPLVIWLHGGIGANNPAKGLRAAPGFVAWADSGQFALLTPSAWPASPWWSASCVQRIQNLVAQACRKKDISCHNRILAGVSDGGSGALWLGTQLRPLWKKELRGIAVWSTNPSVLTAQNVALDLKPLQGLPVRWTAGSLDRLYSPEEVQAWWSRFHLAKIPLQESLNSAADHDLADHQVDLNRFPGWVRGITR